ncbi:MAG: GNAT family N-acetyltransferase [Dysgonamonadaceae bacterium]|jgi:phosphinothricin acetyltransferase|nr:GNAT family N-acetyltransferase [Dysgonamonadaceae bacterium]
MLRKAVISDAGCIVNIYNYYVENTTITFHEDKVSINEMEQKIENILNKNYPFIVLEEDGYIAGYALLNDWRPHHAYKITLETSIYLDPCFVGRGLGIALYKELINNAKDLGIHSLIGVLSIPNEASRKIHTKLGFQLAGIIREAGLKFGQLIDVEFWQLIINC